MRKNPENYTYNYIVLKNYVVCESTFAGKKVKAVAKCHPDDAFDVEAGKKLARLRCAFKIAKKRANYSRTKYMNSVQYSIKALEYERRMHDYARSAEKEMFSIARDLKTFTENL